MFVIIKIVVTRLFFLSLPLDFGPEGEMFIAGGVRFVCFTNFSALFWIVVFGLGPMGLCSLPVWCEVLLVQERFLCVYLFVTVCVVCLYILVLHASYLFIVQDFLHFSKL